MSPILYLRASVQTLDVINWNIFEFKENIGAFHDICQFEVECLHIVSAFATAFKSF